MNRFRHQLFNMIHLTKARSSQQRRLILCTILITSVIYLYIYSSIPSAPARVYTRSARVAWRPHTSDAQNNLIINTDDENTFKFQDLLSVINDIRLNTSKVHKDILIAFADWSYISMAINFYLTSIAPFRMHNYIFLCGDSRTCDVFKEVGIHHFLVIPPGISSYSSSSYGSQDFYRKMQFREALIYKLLNEHITILNCDTDMIFLKDPFQYVRDLKPCALATLFNVRSNYNAGFMYIKPTTTTLQIFRKMEFAMTLDPPMQEQARLNYALKRLHLFSDSSGCVIRLPQDKFQGGRAYFIDGNRVFAGDSPCSDCYVIHNNWIVTMEAKVYRFKEQLFWNYNPDQYYSDPERKYLMYNNPVSFSNVNDTIKLERTVLKSALAICILLNRTLILPSFHVAETDRASLYFVYDLARFDRHFGHMYREHVFLKHSLVPASVKKSVTPPARIITKQVNEQVNDLFQSKEREDVYETKGNAVTEDEILDWFGDLKSSVLYFNSLYIKFAGFRDTKLYSAFENTFHQGVVACGQMQRCPAEVPKLQDS